MSIGNVKKTERIQGVQPFRSLIGQASGASGGKEPGAVDFFDLADNTLEQLINGGKSCEGTACRAPTQYFNPK